MAEEGKEYKTNVSGAARLPDPSRRRELTAEPAARQINTFVQARPSRSIELLQSLKYIRPQIEGYLNTRDAVGRTEAYERGLQDAASQDVVLGETATRITVPPEATAAPAYDPSYINGRAAGIGQRLGNQAVAMRMAEHEANKLKDDYDPIAAGQSFKQEHLNGLLVGNPKIASKVLSDVNSLEGRIILDSKNIELTKLKEATLNDVDANVYSGVEAAAGDPEKYRAFLDSNRQATVSQSQPYRMLNEMDEANLAQAIRYSNENGGTPQLFDAYSLKGADGKSMVERNPELGAKVAIAKARAQAQYEQRLEQANHAANFLTMARLESGWEHGQYVPPQQIAEMTGPGKPFGTASAAMSFWHRQNEKIATQMEYIHMGNSAKDGNLNRATPEAQKRFLEEATKGATTALDQSINDPEQMEATQSGISMMMDYVNRSGASVPLDWLTRKYSGLAQTAPAQNAEPSVAFLNLAVTYESMPDNLKDSYATGDAKALMDGYVMARRNGATAQEAYHKAYTGISPENKRAIAERMKDPEFRKNQLEMRNKVISKSDSNWFYDVENPGTVMGPLGHYMDSWMAQHPEASEEDIKGEMTRFVSRNFIHDASSNKFIGVPSSIGEGAKETVAFTMKKLQTDLGEDTKPYLVHRGDGSYDVMWSPNGVISTRGVIRWSEMDSAHRRSFITGEDEKRLLDINKKAEAGTLKASDIEDIGILSGKLRAAGRDADLPLQQINTIHEKQFNEYFSRQFNVKASEVPSTTPKETGDPFGRNSIVKHYLSSGGITNAKTGTSNYRDLSKSLITTREGVRLTAYNDPARGAGKNIGIGYNLGSRSKEQVLTDFRAAGIPTGYYDDILAGKRSLTSDQARMLLDVTYPQYEKIAMNAINGVREGFWEQLGSHQKAVIIDMAYQLGSARLAKFKSSINAVVSGKAHTMDDIFRVQYTDASGKTGLDRQAYALRAALWNQGAAGFASYLYTNNYVKD